MMRRGGRHTQQVVNILCNSSWYVLQTLVSVAGFRFARRASGRKGVFFGVCRACKEAERGLFCCCTVCKPPARGLFCSLHELQALCEGAFLLFVKGIKGYN